MSIPRIRTRTVARVQITVQVPVGSWGPECKLDQVYQQARDGAIGMLRRLLQRSGIRITGATRVIAVTTDTEARNG